MAVKEAKKGKKVKGCVFWHRQDEDDWRRCGEMYLAYGDLNSKEMGMIGLSTQEVGAVVVEKLKKFQVPYKWNGSPGTRILIKGGR